jgi:hypothetical protein
MTIGHFVQFRSPRLLEEIKLFVSEASLIARSALVKLFTYAFQIRPNQPRFPVIYLRQLNKVLAKPTKKSLIAENHQLFNEVDVRDWVQVYNDKFEKQQNNTSKSSDDEVITSFVVDYIDFFVNERPQTIIQEIKTFL